MGLTRAVTFLLLLIGFIVTSSVASESGGSDRQAAADARQQVLDRGNEWVAAEIKHDAPTLRRILDDKFVASFGTKPPYDKEAFMREETSGEVDPTASQTLTDETVVIDQDTAIVIGSDTARWTDHGVGHTAVFRYTVTYIRRRGQWLALAEHLVEVPETK